MSIGERIKARRKELKMTGEELASKLGCHSTTIYRWESGDIEKVDSSKLLQIANALLTTPMALMGLEENKPQIYTPVLSCAPSGEQPRPDLNRAATVAAQTLINSRVSACPVDPMSILRDMPGVFVATFTEMVGDSGLLDETVAAFGSGSQDAVTYTVSGPLRVVAYNQRLPQYMLQIALARELGFIALGHADADRGPAQVSEALYFARHLLCPRPLIRALQDAGVSLTVETVGNLTGCYGRILAGVRKTPGALVPAAVNRRLRAQLDPYAARCVAVLASISRDDDSGPAMFGSYMDNYEE